jgi:periplasmic divalent cation tolerance protein
MKEEPVVVLVTAPSEEIARAIAYKLLDEKLAACVNILPPVVSIYTWEEAVHEDSEVLMLIKTRSDLLEDRLIPTIKNLHPYEVPEIIALPIIQGLDSYLSWISDSVK